MKDESCYVPISKFRVSHVPRESSFLILNFKAPKVTPSIRNLKLGVSNEFNFFEDLIFAE